MARIKAKIRKPQEIVAQTVKISGTLRLGDLVDVDTGNQSDGAMMIFNENTGRYEVTTQLQNENLNIIGGTY